MKSSYSGKLGGLGFVVNFTIGAGNGREDHPPNGKRAAELYSALNFLALKQLPDTPWYFTGNRVTQNLELLEMDHEKMNKVGGRPGGR